MKITITKLTSKLLFTICASLLGIHLASLPFSSSVVMGLVMNLLRGIR